MSYILSQNSVNVNELFDSFEEIIDGKIYKITNLINGKIYIGQTIKSIEHRWNGHCTKSRIKKSAITAAIFKYGVENFIIEQIDSAMTYNELNQKEYDWIIKENCLAPNGYNLRDGGMMGSVSEETRQKHSQSFKGRKSIYNLNTGEQRFIFENEEIPIDFEYGGNKIANESEERRNKISLAHKNKIYVVDKNDEKIYKIDKDLFDGRIMTKYCPDHNLNRTAYINPETNQVRMLKDDDEIPEDYIKGGMCGRIVGEETRKNYLIYIKIKFENINLIIQM